MSFRKLTGILFVVALLMGGLASRGAAIAGQPRAIDSTAWSGLGPVQEQSFKRFENGAILTPVYINKTGPYPMLVDTGAFLSSLDKVVVSGRSLHHKVLGKINVVGSDGKGSMPVLQFDTLHVAGHRLKNPKMLELPFQPGRSSSLFKGILGTDVLANFALGFDLRREVLVFFPGGVDLVDRQPDYFDVIPMRFNRKTNGLTAKVYIHGKKYKALVDTGASRTVIATKVAKRLGLESVEGVKVRLRGVFRNTKFAKVVQVASLRAGSREWSDVSVLVADWPSGGERYSVVIGMDLLAENSFVIDYGHKRVLLIKP